MIQQAAGKYLHRLKFRATGIGLDLARLCLQHDDKEMVNTAACQVVKNHNEEQQVLEKLTRLYREAGAEEEGKATEQRGNAGCDAQPAAL
ncbi:MAG TPA: hypothetical protein VIQ75_02145 [Gammaproteobacteria bacterium]